MRVSGQCFSLERKLRVYFVILSIAKTQHHIRHSEQAKNPVLLPRPQAGEGWGEGASYPLSLEGRELERG